MNRPYWPEGVCDLKQVLIGKLNMHLEICNEPWLCVAKYSKF